VVITPLEFKRKKASGGYLVQVQDITDRNHMESKILHLNQLLRATSDISQLIAQAKEREKILRGACGALFKISGCRHCWIKLFDEHKRPTAVAEAGLGKRFSPIIRGWKREEMPECAQRALSQSAAIVTETPSSVCAGCALIDNCDNNIIITIRLEHNGQVYGMLSVSVANDYIKEEEQLSLLEGIAEDIALALYCIEAQKQHERLVDTLTRLAKFI